MSALPAVRKFVANNGVRIYRIPCQVFETLTARVYLLIGIDRPTLVDAGSGTSLSTRHILDGIEAVRREFGEPIRAADVRRIIVSHGHIDHIGGLSSLLQAMPDADVAIHALDQKAVTSHREYLVAGNSRLSAFFREAGVDPKRRAELLKVSHFGGLCLPPVKVSLTLTDGQMLDGLRIIHTPGHSPGHICIAIDNILLSADHILARTVPQQWPESVGAYTGIGHYLESLDKIARMPGIELTLAAHEQSISDVYGRINSIRGAHERRLERLLTTLGKAARPLSVAEISHELYPDVTGFRALLAITDVGARIEYLHQHARLAIDNLDAVEHDEQPVYRYRV